MHTMMHWQSESNWNHNGLFLEDWGGNESFEWFNPHHTNTYTFQRQHIHVRQFKQFPVLGNHAIPVQMAALDHVYFILI